jgi:hypothetical protein
MLLACCPDTNGDGRPDVLVSYWHREEKSDGLRGEIKSCWLGVLSGRNGKLLWTDEAPEKNTRSEEDVPYPQFVDLDGDGKCDVLLALKRNETQESEANYELQARRGLDGRLLWRLSFGGDSNSWKRERLAEAGDDARGPLDPPCKIGDLDGDGRPEVVLMDEGKGAILVLNGASGELRASYAVPTGLNSGRAQRLCLADFGGDRKRTVIASVPGDYSWRPDSAAGPWAPIPPKLAFFAFSNNALERQSAAEVDAWILASADVDGDGKQELIVVHGAREKLRVRVCRDTFEQMLWEQPVSLPTCDRMAPAEASQPMVLVVRGSDNAFEGRDAASGRLLWRVPGGAPLLGTPDSARCRCVWQYGETTECRAAIPASPEAVPPSPESVAPSGTGHGIVETP